MGNHTQKKRSVIDYSGFFENRVYLTTTGELASDKSAKYGVVGGQVTDSRSHPEFFQVRRAIWDVKRRLERYPNNPGLRRALERLKNSDIGGAFWTMRLFSTLSSPRVTVWDKTSSIKRIQLDGQFLPHTTPYVTTSDGVWPARPDTTAELLLCSSLGATAIARTAPTKPIISLANVLGELYNDGLPSLLGSTMWRAGTLAQKIKSSGGEYLNVEFAWKPLLSDILNISKTVVEANKLLQEYEERSGKIIGRHYEFPISVTTTSSTEPAGIWPSVDGSFIVTGSLAPRTTTVSTVRKYWFEGAYKYTLPTGSESRTQMALYAAKAEKLLGLQPTAEVLWNLAPWTWLSDWFLNFGDVVTSMTAFSKDNLMLNRGYIMCSARSTKTITHPGMTLKHWGSTGTISQTFTTEMKMRQRASPWGFGLKVTDLSPRQIAILASLGISQDWEWGR